MRDGGASTRVVVVMMVEMRSRLICMILMSQYQQYLISDRIGEWESGNIKDNFKFVVTAADQMMMIYAGLAFTSFRFLLK